MKISIEHEITDEIKSQLTELATVGAMNSSNDINICEDDYPNTKEGYEQFLSDRRKAYDSFSDEEKKLWFNGVLCVLGFEFEEEQLPYMRTSMHSQSFIETIKMEARKKFPQLYIAFFLSEQVSNAERTIRNILRNEDF